MLLGLGSELPDRTAGWKNSQGKKKIFAKPFTIYSVLLIPPQTKHLLNPELHSLLKNCGEWAGERSGHEGWEQDGETVWRWSGSECWGECACSEHVLHPLHVIYKGCEADLGLCSGASAHQEARMSEDAVFEGGEGMFDGRSAQPHDRRCWLVRAPALQPGDKASAELDSFSR